MCGLWGGRCGAPPIGAGYRGVLPLGEPSGVPPRCTLGGCAGGLDGVLGLGRAPAGVCVRPGQRLGAGAGAPAGRWAAAAAWPLYGRPHTRRSSAAAEGSSAAAKDRPAAQTLALGACVRRVRGRSFRGCEALVHLQSVHGNRSSGSAGGHSQASAPSAASATSCHWSPAAPAE